MVYLIVGIVILLIFLRIRKQSDNHMEENVPMLDLELPESDEHHNSRLPIVRRNLVVEQNVFRRYGIIFQCNLIEDYDCLQLNFELLNTKRLAAQLEKDSYLNLKANVYDAKGRLLCIEEVWLEYHQLRSGYTSDYFYFADDTMSRAHSMKVYAIDPTEDYEGDEETPADMEQIVRTEHRDLVVTEPTASAVQSVLREHQGWSDDLRKGLKPNHKDSASKVYDWKLKETWEDYPAPDYNASHTYCRVSFTEDRRTYYYRTRNPDLRVGDRVYVPFGHNAPKRIGTIVSMEECIGREAPFPLEKTKHIIGKVEE